MLTKNINFKNFKLKKNNKKIEKDFRNLLGESNEILKSLSSYYKNSYHKNLISKFKSFTDVRIIGMGGSILGAQSIYDFLKIKIKKTFYFINNLESKISFSNKKIKQSVSGNTNTVYINPLNSLRFVLNKLNLEHD